MRKQEKNYLELCAESPNCVRDACPKYQEQACQTVQVSVKICLRYRLDTDSCVMTSLADLDLDLA